MDDAKTNTMTHVEETDDDDKLGFVLAFLAICIIVSDFLRREIGQGFQELPDAVRENLGLATAIAACGIIALPEWKGWIAAPFTVPYVFSVFGWGFISMIERCDPTGAGDFFGNDAAYWGRRALILAFPTIGLTAITALH